MIIWLNGTFGAGKTATAAALVVATAAELIRFTGQHLIAPQTVLDRCYLAEIFDGLRAVGVDVFHVVLDADVTVLSRRIEGSDEARQWRLDHLVQYQAAHGWLIKDADLIVDTSAMRPVQVAERIAAALPAIRVHEACQRQPSGCT